MPEPIASATQGHLDGADETLEWICIYGPLLKRGRALVIPREDAAKLVASGLFEYTAPDGREPFVQDPSRGEITRLILKYTTAIPSLATILRTCDGSAWGKRPAEARQFALAARTRSQAIRAAHGALREGYRWKK